MKRRRKKLLFLLLICGGFQAPVAAQENITGLLREVDSINHFYRSTQYLGFNIALAYADSAAPLTPLYQLQGIGQSHYSYTRYLFDSSEYLCGKYFEVAVYHDQKVIEVLKPVPYHHFIKVTLPDSLNKSMQLDTAFVHNTNDTVRVLTVHFKPGQPYAGYELSYDPTSWIIQRVSYWIHDVPDPGPGPGRSATSVVSVQFTGRDASIINEFYMWEGRFLDKEGAVFSLKPAYSSYQLITGTGN